MREEILVDEKKLAKMKRTTYAEIWGDVVDVKHLAYAIIIGLTISLSFYIIGVKIIHLNSPKLAANLSKAYGLLIGMVGSLISAFISAKLFKPKRVVNEDNYIEEDREAVLKELGVDLEQEAEMLKTADPQIIDEMKKLGIYELFSGKNKE